MRNGDRNQLITIQRNTQTGVDNLHAPVFAWAAWKEVFAAVIAKRGRESFSDEGQQRFFTGLVHFRCNYFDVEGVDTTMRISFEGKIYDVKNIVPDYHEKDDVLVEAELVQ